MVHNSILAFSRQRSNLPNLKPFSCPAEADGMSCCAHYSIVARGGRKTGTKLDTHTDTQTHRPSTVTLAAHVRASSMCMTVRVAIIILYHLIK